MEGHATIRERPMAAMDPLTLCRVLQKAVGRRKQQDVARDLDITPQYLCDILGGRKKLSAAVAIRLKDALRVDGRKLYLAQAEYELKFATDAATQPQD